jgi:ATP-dependent DNA helicase RecG
MDQATLQKPVAYLKGVGPERAKLLESELNISTYQDLIHLFPNRYIDRTQYHKINHLQQSNAEVQVIGKITDIRMVKQGRGKRLVADFQDDTGKMELVWFRGHKWIREKLKANTAYVAFGKINRYGRNFSMAHPDLEFLNEHKEKKMASLQPVYPSTEKLAKKGLSNRVVRKIIYQLFQESRPDLLEPFSEGFRKNLNLIEKSRAIFNVHFPQSHHELQYAQYRMKFEELFFVQLQLLRKNRLQKKKIKGYVFDQVGNNFHGFYKTKLPFELTSAQKRVVKEIRSDMRSGAQMNRLLQGDVGSGKTIVALMACLIALDNNFQSCLMAPTETLAIQHFNGLSEFCEGLGLKIALLTGSVKAKKRREIHEQLQNGELFLLIGTHAVLEEKVKFNNLGLAIIDEQHRFGVAQRSKLWQKNNLPPHILVMTATPIPRTLAMSLYGDLDISTIDELPPGRKPVKTVHRFDNSRLSVFKFIKDEIKKGLQVYVVYPLIEESAKMDYKDLMDGFESIEREFPKPAYQISIVHGRMKPADKDFEMNRFVKGETQIMIATTVIEVGINVPNATLMVIESAERFGLSQLHQLRGRVGRGAEQSYCILMTGHKLSQDSKTRLETMTSTNDGFKIAETDLEIRGPGNMMGTQQSGVLNLQIADIVKDNQILKTARIHAKKLVEEDPNFELPHNKGIQLLYHQMEKGKTVWKYIS